MIATKSVRASLGLLASLTAVLALLIFGTTPQRIGPIGVTGFFMILFGWFFVLFDLIWAKYYNKNRSSKYNIFHIAILAGLPTAALALQSLRQLQLRDIVLILALLFATWLYWSKQG